MSQAVVSRKIVRDPNKMLFRFSDVSAPELCEYRLQGSTPCLPERDRLASARVLQSHARQWSDYRWSKI